MNRRDRSILIALSWHVRVLSVSQIASSWWHGCTTAKRLANDWVRARVEGGWLTFREVISRSTTPLDSPLVTWEPSQELPDFDDLSRYLHRRARTPARRFKVAIATRKCKELFGVEGAACRPKLAQLSHELFVSEVFIRYRENGVDVDAAWVGEDVFPDDWPVRTRPDALIQNDDYEIIRAVEYGGAYSVRRLRTIHDALESISLPYEIW